MVEQCNQRQSGWISQNPPPADASEPPAEQAGRVWAPAMHACMYACLGSEVCICICYTIHKHTCLARGDASRQRALRQLAHTPNLLSNKPAIAPHLSPSKHPSDPTIYLTHPSLLPLIRHASGWSSSLPLILILIILIIISQSRLVPRLLRHCPCTPQHEKSASPGPSC
jgi:hypothetical protein